MQNKAREKLTKDHSSGDGSRAPSGSRILDGPSLGAIFFHLAPGLRFLQDVASIVGERPQEGTKVFITLMKLSKNEDGATAIEYGLIAALIAVAAIAAMGLVGTSLTNIFTTVASKL